MLWGIVEFGCVIIIHFDCIIVFDCIRLFLFILSIVLVSTKLWLSDVTIGCFDDVIIYEILIGILRFCLIILTLDIVNLNTFK